ncbi:PREDICTED: heparan-alpha-glucosaminide N-acetyltransferase-like isoform X2 [Ipomoea nil]|uniref:heparan-alpha-glucosaminide N-acetyltransferase-like isoform X2 n=1 Tax=Ipomoea nil TaxID=35883 RepID=UPI0009018F44|nr:PREDICTED: heparan-alpha-glucosaminide N-acetyltransferase-like isoform X2 [Ipomoea nil]
MGSYPYQLITQHLRRDHHFNNRTAPTSDLPHYFSLQIEPPAHTHHAHLSPKSAVPSPLSTNPAPRLLSLDVFRGIAVALMILVEDAGGIFPSINHSPWNGLTLADIVMPFFLFIVGLSLGLAYKNLSNRTAATGKAIFRALKLLIIGVFLQGGYFHGLNNLTYGVDITQIRWTGVLQRIAIAYFVTAISEIWLKNDCKVDSGLSLLKRYQYQWAMAFVLIAIYLSLLYGLYVPDWEYQIPAEMVSSDTKILSHSLPFKVKCGVRGDTGPACNAAGMVDRTVLGIQHLYRRPIYARTKECSVNSPDYGPLPIDAPSWCQAPFDPEGLLSSLMAIVTCFVGVHFGHVIIHFKVKKKKKSVFNVEFNRLGYCLSDLPYVNQLEQDHKTRILQWIIPSCCLLLLGVTCNFFGMHINKVLYSFSYTCVTAGTAGVVFAGAYIMVDVYGCRHLTSLLEWMGMNALLIYVLVSCNIIPIVVQGLYWRLPQNNIVSMIGIGHK